MYGIRSSIYERCKCLVSQWYFSFAYISKNINRCLCACVCYIETKEHVCVCGITRNVSKLERHNFVLLPPQGRQYTVTKGGELAELLARWT